MKRTVKHIFKTKSVLTDVNGQIPQLGNHKLTFANSETIVLDEGTIHIQHFSHFLFFLELTSFKLHKDFAAGFVNEKTRLFIFMMLKGNITLSTIDGLPIIEVEANSCYATYSRKGEFLYNLSKGNHEFLYFCPRTDWIGKHHDYCPRIGQFLKDIKADRKLFDHMTTCTIDKNMQRLLKHLFSLQNSDQIDFEFSILRSIKSIINQYQLLLDSKFSQRAYLVKDYLEAHYTEFIDNKILADQFFTTEKTVIKTFRQEFETTPYSHLISVRMEHAKSLLVYKKLSPTQVYKRVGYLDFQSFRKQFKSYFGIPPSACH